MVKSPEAEPLTKASKVPLPNPHHVISSCEDQQRSSHLDISKCEGSSQTNVVLNGMLPRETERRVEVPLLRPSPLRKNSNTNSDTNEYPNQLKTIPCDEFHVPLPLTTHVRNIYTETLSQYHDLISPSLVGEVTPAHKSEKIESVLNDLQRLCNYLEPIQNDVSAHRHDLSIYEAKYAENISTKCMFLVELLSLLREYNKHVTILVRPGKLFEILETIFKAHEFYFSRADDPENYIENFETSKMRVTLATTASQVKTVRGANILIIFDSYFPPASNLERAREKEFETRYFQGIVLHLVIMYSTEHLKNILEASNIQFVDNTRILELLFCMKGKVGTLPNGYPGPSEAAEAVVRYILCEEEQKTWPLFPLPDIDDKSEILHDGTSNLPSRSRGILEIPQDSLLLTAFVKRVSDNDECIARSESPKRHKVSDFSDLHRYRKEALFEVRKAQTADGWFSESQPPIIDDEDGNVLQTSFQKAVIESESCISSLQRKLSALQNELRHKKIREEELCHMNEELELRCHDFECSLKIIQPRYQEALNDRGLFEHEKGLAISRENELRQKLENTQATLLKIQLDKSKVDEELDRMRLSILNSSIPEAVELEKKRVEVLNLQAENERLRNQNQIIQSDFDYMQSNYQTASTSAASSAKQVLALNSEIKKLKAKASENAVNIHRIHVESALNEHQLTIRGLRAVKTELERQLERLAGQYTALMNGRPVTRSNSVPRSPRMGASGPSPRPINRIMGKYDGNG